MKKLIIIVYATLITHSFNLFSQENNKRNSINSTVENTTKHPLLTSKFVANIGVFVPSKTIEIQADGATPNDLIDFNKVFQLNQRESTFAANIKWRFTENWSLSVEYFGIKNGNSNTLTKDIEWNDVVYKTGIEVKGGFEMDLYRVFFGRNISTGQKHELGGGIGIHIMDILTYIEGEAFINNVSTGFRREDINALAPLPNIGFWYHYAPSSKFLLSLRTDWLALKVSNVNGRLWNVSPSIQYQIFNNLGVNFSYRYFSLNIDVEETEWHGSANLKFDGPLFTITGNF